MDVEEEKKKLPLEETKRNHNSGIETKYMMQKHWQEGFNLGNWLALLKIKSAKVLQLREEGT